MLSQDYAEKKFEYAEAEQYNLRFIHLTKRTAEKLELLLKTRSQIRHVLFIIDDAEHFEIAYDWGQALIVSVKSPTNDG